MEINDKPKNEQEEASRQNEKAVVQPEPETLHTTDPQDEMKGPVSSVVQGIKENFEEGDKEPKKDAEEEVREREEG